MTVQRVRIGVVGAGLIAQWEHIPNLLRLSELFELVGVADPSPTARDFVGRHFGVTTYPDSDALLGETLDAVVIASPDFTHVEEMRKSLSRGLHVFCEKPLCYGPRQVDAILSAQETADTIVQVGYMKRHDPSYEACLELLPDHADRLRLVSVDVIDPDSWPYQGIHPGVFSDDLCEETKIAGRAAAARQIADALGFAPSPLMERGFATTLCSSLVHDVNATAGLLERMGVSPGPVTGGSLFAGGDGGSGMLQLLDGQAQWQMSFVSVTAVADYNERITLTFDDMIVELKFPSPYLNHRPTRLRVSQSDGSTFDMREIRPGYGESFVNELEAFWAAINGVSPVRNTVEQAQRDQALLCDLARHIADRQPGMKK